MDTPYYFSSMRQEKSRAGGDEKLNINFMWSNQDTFFCPKVVLIREVSLYYVPVCKYRWPLVSLWLVHTH